MAKTINVFAAAVAAAAVFSGCGNNAEQNVAASGEKPLIMITEAGFPPYEYDEGGKIVGVDVEICKAIADKLGRPLTIQDAKFDAVIPSVIAGKADFAAAGITVTEDRKQNVDFSVPYVTSGIVIVSKKGEEYTSVEAIKGKRIGVQSGTTSDNFCVETVGQEPERYDAPPTAAAALVAGKVDALIVDIDPAKNIVKGTDAIVISSDFLTKEEFAVAIRKGQPELLAAMNEVIEGLVKSGKVEEWKAEYDARYANLRAVEEKAATGLGAIGEKLSTAVSEGAAAVADTAKAATEKVAEEAVAVKDAVADTAKAATEKVAEEAVAVKDAVADTAKAAVEKAAEGAAAVKDAVADTAKAAVEKAAEGAAAVKDAVADTAKAAAEKTEAAAEKAVEKTEAVAEKAAEKTEAAAEAVKAAVAE